MRMFMAVGHAPLPSFQPIKGVRMGTACAGIKKPNHADVTVFEIAENSTVAGVFTKNRFCAAPVQICQQHLQHHADMRYLLINTGNANAGTGETGFRNANATLEALAKRVNTPINKLLPFSTGVIGEHLPVDKIAQALPEALKNLDENHWDKAANAIMTTDTRPKGVSKTLRIKGRAVNISGISKGSGMIQPNMATMLAFVACDAAIPALLLQDLIQKASELSFNRITVDGDTSTNDSAVLIATGQGEFSLAEDDLDSLHELQEALTEVFIELAQLIVRDGEGATKFVSVKVAGGLNEADCVKAAKTIAESPLVKTALFASDANWGRILAALGRSYIDGLDVDKVELRINGVLIAEQGGRAASYTEEAGQQALAQEDLAIDIQLNLGKAEATVWTCDLSHDYVSINADYRS